jgi:ABC-2 type transport system permease protein/oleandomycin transport system permease protein
MTVLLITGVIIGFSFQTNVWHVIAGIGVLLLFGYAFSWVFAFLGLLVKTPEAANSVGFIAVFPLTFISSAFVPTQSLPTPLRQFAEVNPFTIVVNELRWLWTGQHSPDHLWQAFAWVVFILVVFAPLAVARYRRTASR